MTLTAPPTAGPRRPGPPHVVPPVATGITIYGCDPDEAAAFRAAAPRHGLRATVTGAAASAGTVGLAVGSRCVSVGHKAPVDGPTLVALSRAGVRHLSTRSVGRDHIDTDVAARVGIEVGSVAYSPDGVADFTVMTVLMALRRAKSLLRRADRHDYRLERVRGRELRDLTVGVVGTGRIGTAVIERLRGFGCRVLAHDARATSAGHVALEDLLRRSDVVTLHVPLDDGTHHLLDARRIALMRHGAIVVNTGRGALVDTAALLAGLEAGRLGGAALDVVEGEQGIFYADCRGTQVRNEALVRLQGRPDVVITPHTAFHTDRALADTVEETLLGCVGFLARGPR